MSLENVTSIDSYFQELEKKLVLKSACNLTTEKIKFFNSNYTYNPQFIYPEPTPCTFSSQIDKQIQQIGDPIIGKLYEAKHEEYKQKHKFLSSSGNSEEEFTKQSILFFGKPEEFALAIAHQICENLPQLHFGRKNKANIRFRTIAKRLRAYLKQHKFKGKLNVLHGKTVANHVSVSKAKGTLNISRNYISDEDELTDIIYHEIETHMRRLENATKLKYELFRLGTARYLAYEEGLATITGHAKKRNKLLWHPALLLIAMDSALRNDFKTVFLEINSLIKNPFFSWSYAVRVKQGISNTFLPGAYTKDQYLQWAILRMKEIIEDPELLSYAYNGKASFKELKEVSDPEKNTPITIEEVRTLAQHNFILD